MKLLKSLSVLTLAIFITACSSDDDNTMELSGEGNLELFFDNSVNGDDLLLGASTYTNSNDETLTITRFNYIVSNVVLINEMGEEFIYPADESYFIISEEQDLFEINLENIPSDNYTQIKFGVGVPQEKYLRGESEQQEFWDYAATLNMTWSWIAGYKFINYEGTYTSPEVDGSKNFRVHMGSLGSSQDNYRELTVDLPTQAMVRPDRTPNVHVVADANHILDGANSFKLSEILNDAGTSQIMVDEVRSPLVAENATQMFVVDHVHTSSTDHN